MITMLSLSRIEIHRIIGGMVNEIAHSIEKNSINIIITHIHSRIDFPIPAST